MFRLEGWSSGRLIPYNGIHQSHFRRYVPGPPGLRRRVHLQNPPSVHPRATCLANKYPGTRPRCRQFRYRQFSPAFQVSSRILLVRVPPPPKDSFSSFANLGAVFAPADAFYPDNLEFCKVRMNDSDDPISKNPFKFKDPSLEDPDLIHTVPMEISQRILLPRCPAYKCQIRTRTRIIVERNVAIQPSGTDILPFSFTQVSVSTED